MNHLQLRSKVMKGEAEKLLGSFVDDNSYDFEVTNDATVYDLEGKRILVFQKDALPQAAIDMAMPALRSLKSHKTSNRGNYAGSERAPRLRKDGVVSNTNIATPVASSVIGYFDRYPRIPFCRETSFTAKEVEHWAAVQPLIRSVAKAYASLAPDKYAKAMEVVKRTHSDWVIPETPFTTLTVNNTVRGAVHYDKGDLKVGLGAICAFPSVNTRGCKLVFPEHRVAVELRSGDLLLFDSHQMHGNTPIVMAGNPVVYKDASGEVVGGFTNTPDRVSVVFYYREGMTQCLSREQEAERAKHLHGSLGIELDIDEQEQGKEP